MIPRLASRLAASYYMTFPMQMNERAQKKYTNECHPHNNTTILLHLHNKYTHLTVHSSQAISPFALPLPNT